MKKLYCRPWSGRPEQLPLGVYKLLKSGNLFFYGQRNILLSRIRKGRLSISSFDSIYEKHDQFEDVYQEIVETLFK